MILSAVKYSKSLFTGTCILIVVVLSATWRVNAFDKLSTQERIVELLCGSSWKFCNSEAREQANLVPTNVQGIALQALEAMSSQQYNHSISLLDEALKIAPNSAILLLWKGYGYEFCAIMMLQGKSFGKE
jgi:hypothetical protein